MTSLGASPAEVWQSRVAEDAGAEEKRGIGEKSYAGLQAALKQKGSDWSQLVRPMRSLRRKAEFTGVTSCTHT